MPAPSAPRWNFAAVALLALAGSGCRLLDVSQVQGFACGPQQACPAGQNCCDGLCASGACASTTGPCDPVTCSGCCQGTVCQTGTADSACGVNNHACQACPANSTCAGGTCTGCDATNCPSGCCFNGVCSPSSNAQCGTGGSVCANCLGGPTEACVSGRCVCGGGSPCAAGQLCTNGACTCDPTTCTGGRRCVGASCVCDAASCPTGCCDAQGQCRQAASACGLGGGACTDCGATADGCDAGHCGCGPQAPCASGQRCSGGACVCDATSCPSGCCQGNVCAQVSFAACGAAGLACSACSLATADSCTGGQCQCGATAACAGNRPCDGGHCMCQCYADRDHDTFYGVEVSACPCPAGSVEMATPPSPLDCDDSDALARPNQPGYSPIPRLSGGFDFNCDGVDELGYQWDAGSDAGCAVECAGLSAYDGGCDGFWWDGPVPACGVAEVVLGCATAITGSVRSCVCVPANSGTTVTQTCR